MSFILKFWKKLQGNWRVQLATDVTGMEVKRHCLLFCLCKNVLQIFYQSAVEQFLIDSCVNPHTLLIREREREHCLKVCRATSFTSKCKSRGVKSWPIMSIGGVRLIKIWARLSPQETSTVRQVQQLQLLRKTKLQLKASEPRWHTFKKNIPYSGNRPRPWLKKSLQVWVCLLIPIKLFPSCSFLWLAVDMEPFLSFSLQNWTSGTCTSMHSHWHKQLPSHRYK